MNSTQRQLDEVRSFLAAGNSVPRALATTNALYTSELNDMQQQVQNEILGLGQTLMPLLTDPHITDVVINGVTGVWVDRGAGMEKIEVSDEQLKTDVGVRALATRLAAICGQRLDDASPIVDGTFPSGVRLNAVLPPLSAQGTLISLRTHKRTAFTLQQLSQAGSIDVQLLPLIKALVNRHANVIISGATGAGKTTFLNAVLSEVASAERILIIEEAAELRPTHPHVVHLQVRNANVQGVGQISMSDLVRSALRMRPDRIVLGECRGVEVRDVLGALNTGHDGGWATIHANSATDVPARLVALGALAGMNEATVSAQAASALDAVIHISRQNGKRFISQIAVLERHGEHLFSVDAYIKRKLDGNVTVTAEGKNLAHRFGVNDICG